MSRHGLLPTPNSSGVALYDVILYPLLPAYERLVLGGPYLRQMCQMYHHKMS